MKRLSVIMAVSAAFLLSASCTCSHEGREAETGTTEIKAEKIVPVYVGTYEGTLPAADCPGIKTTLKINGDTTYELRSEYIDRDEIFEESGVYELKDGMIILVTPSSGRRTYYKIMENALAMTDEAGKLAEGELAFHYTLNRKN